jgi:hypothetical protein
MADSKRASLEEFVDHMPLELRDNPEFREAWRDWLMDRKERHKAVTTRGAMLSLRKLGTWKYPIESINQSIEHGWQGLFEYKPIQHGGRTVNNPSGRPTVDRAAIRAALSD